MPGPDMREYRVDLRGEILPTIVTGAPNALIDVVGSSVILPKESRDLYFERDA